MAVKVFTVQEANAILPAVQEAVRFVRDRAREIVVAQDALSVLSLIGAQSPKSPDHADMHARHAELQRLAEAYHSKLEELQAIGCVVKDLNQGLVDFYAQHKDHLVFLCWKLGEKKISFWHDLEGGYTKRRPIRELQEEQEED
jgi:hypothetical protein